MTELNEKALEAAAKAHTPQFERMDADIQRYALEQMRAAISAYLSALPEQEPVARYDLIKFDSCGAMDALMERHPEGEWVKWEDVSLFASPIAHPLRDGSIYAAVSKRQFSEEENAAIDQDIAGKLSAGYAELIRELVGALKRIERWHGEFPETGEYWDKEKTQMMSYAACFGSNGERDFMRNIARSSLARAEAEGFAP
jgi:hypothetical protein